MAKFGIFSFYNFVIIALFPFELPGYFTAEVRVKRALFNTGKFLNSKTHIDAEGQGSKMEEDILSVSAEKLFATLLQQVPDIKLESKKKLPDAASQKPKPARIPKITIPKVSKAFSSVIRKFLAKPLAMPDLMYDNEGENEESIPLIGDRTAETLCQMIKHEVLPKDEAEYLLVPLKQVNYQGSDLDLNNFDKVWYERGCYSWKLESCEGYSRFPLEPECKFWNPIATENPGCPQLDRRIKVDWRTLSPKNCTCKYPCTLKYASVQECYLPHVSQPKVLPNTDERITLGLEHIRYLCRAVSQVYGLGTSIGIKWIPIKLQLSFDNENNIVKDAKNCYHYTYIPCHGNLNQERRQCGKWIKEQITCKDNEEIGETKRRSLSSKEIDRVTLQCPCELPCLRIFDSINKCTHFDEIARKLDMSSEELKMLKPSEVFKRGEKINEVSNRIIECNYFERNVHCTVIPKYEEVEYNSKSKKHSSKRIGSVQCSYVDGKPLCPFEWNY